MGLLAKILQKINKSESGSIQSDPLIQDAKPNVAYWVGDTVYAVPVVGTSHYRQHIEEIAQNPNGYRAVVFATAELRLEPNNQFDPNAVAVYIEDKKVGHLARGFAPVFRQKASLAEECLTTFADAVITNGLRIGDKEYEYTIDLDIPQSFEFIVDPLREHEITRGCGYPPLLKNESGDFTVDVWIPVSDFSDLHRLREVNIWTTDAWDTVNFYIMNRQGIGLGYKIYEMPKAKFEELFSIDTVQASVDLNQSRFATLRVVSNSERIGAP